jgi:membrane protein DedA with SNARE-associated domain
MNMASFLFYSSVGAGIWTALLAYAGYILRAKFETVGEYLNPASYVVFVVIVLMYFVRVFNESRKKHSIS